MDSSVLTVFWYAMLTAVATGLGALPFVFVKKYADKTIAHGNAMASGLMLAASFRLVSEGLNYGAGRTVVGIVVGLLFIFFTNRALEGNGQKLSVQELRGADTLKMILIVGVMTLHSVAEGVGVGVSFAEGIQFGLFITIAIAIHNIPEGLAISLVLAPRGVSVWKCALWSVFSSLPQPLLAVPAFLFVETFRPFLPVGLGFAAGAMIWMVISELLPDSFEKADPGAIASTATLSVAAMVLFQALIDV